MTLASFHNFAQAVSPIGGWVLAIAIGVMLVDGTLLVIYTIRRGQKSSEEGKTVSTDRPMWPVWFRGAQAWRRRSRQKVLLSRESFVSNESIADGSATLTERLTVIGIIVFIICFALIFVGAGLMILKDNPIIMLMSAAVLLWTFKLLKGAYDDRRRMKCGVAAQKRPTDNHPPPSPEALP